MQQLPFILVAFGIICIIISFFLPDKGKREKQEKKEQLTPEERANLIAQGKKEIDGIFNNKAEDAIEKVDEQLSRISNEKIISVSEYSDQVLEKINQNHQEVVFLYNMLNEKEEEMKKMMSKMKVASKDDILSGKQEEQLAKRAQELSKVSQKSQLSTETFHNSTLLTQMEETRDFASADQDRFQDNADMEMLRGLIYEDEVQKKNSTSSEREEQRILQQTSEQAEENSLPRQVLEMYQNGMSVLEISRVLHKGQGEVRLVIDLYGGNRR